MNSSKKIVFENFSVTINDLGFYEIEVFNDKEFGFEELTNLKESQVKMGAQHLPVLVLCGSYSSTDTVFLKHLSKNENNPYSKADAFVITSIAQKILANFYIKIFIPERPTRFFKTKEDAIIWLKQYI